MTLEEEITIRYNRGLERGEQIGIEKGRSEGAEFKQHEIAKNMKVKLLDPETISELTGLSLAEIEKL